MTFIESKVRYDAKADVLYLVCDAGEIARSIEVSSGITAEFGDVGNILGVEILRASTDLTERVIGSPTPDDQLWHTRSPDSDGSGPGAGACRAHHSPGVR
jgi:uncharacterized protein YuzE